MASGYYGYIRQQHYKGPVWELPNGKQLTLDYQGVSLMMELLKLGSGDCLMYQRQAGKVGGVTHTDTLWVMYDGERVFFEMFRSYPKPDSDFMMAGGGQMLQDQQMDPNERFWSMWEPDYSTSVTWQWTPEELKQHLAEPEGR